MNNETKPDVIKVRRNEMNDRSPAKHRFNVLDAVLIVILLVAAALVVAVYSPLDIFGSSAKKTKITFTVEIEGVDASLASKIAVGDTVMNGNSCFLGTVVSPVEVEADSKFFYNPATGETEYAEHPDLSDLLIVITVNADTDAERGFSVNGVRLAAGAEYSLVLPGFEGEGTCISIIEEKIEEGEAE
ncbi:MAG: DUF4330 domain-containing protein [Clostridia bacterium]|nr:DUF4330 domain-containing protein [Clostridia bacterium]